MHPKVHLAVKYGEYEITHELGRYVVVVHQRAVKAIVPLFLLNLLSLIILLLKHVAILVAQVEHFEEYFAKEVGVGLGT